MNAASTSPASSRLRTIIRSPVSYMEVNALEPLIKVVDLRKHFYVGGMFFTRRAEVVKAVDGLSFTIAEGETMGLVGESGCGKTTAGRTLLRLIDPTAGRIYFMDQDITEMSEKDLRKFRCDMQIVFQDPYSSLNPRLTVKEIVGEPVKLHKIARGDEVRERVAEALRVVGLAPEHMNRYPHEFSGGQRQRIAIARALILKSKFIVLDEPTSALDVSVAAQVLNLLKELQRELGLTYLFISHDLSVVKFMSDKIAVMYLGKIAELTNSKALVDSPLHPYTQALLSAIPVTDPSERGRERMILSGTPPSPINPPSGCRFHTRCPARLGEICDEEDPPFVEVREDHYVACHLMSSG